MTALANGQLVLIVEDNEKNLKLARDLLQYHGFRTIEVLRDGQMVGMLSVNGYTGAVWYHFWHGTFAEEWQRPNA